MELQFGHERFWTTDIRDNDAGYSGVELHRERFGETVVAARVVYWDASRHFAVETFGEDVWVDVIEKAVAEAQVRVGLR
jgi:hypothetical protein